MVQEFIKVVGEWITGMITWLSSIFTGITGLFYDSSTEGGGFTFLGILMLFGLAVGLIYYGINFIRKLIEK